jgi:hypothetical protein
MSDFESGTISVGTLFDAKSFYRIPSYQRPFSWDEEQFDDLVTDTRDAEREAPYFLGNIVLHVDKDGTKVIVDGQQRITSLMILLACLRDAIDDQKVKSEIQDKILQQARTIDKIPQRLRLEVKDRDMFQSVVVDDGGTLKIYDKADYSEPAYRYVIASTIFHKRIDALTQDERIDLVQFIISRCVLIFLQANSFDEAFRLFEIVNDRGKQLRRIDILKSKNTSPDVITQDSIRDKISAEWEALESQVGEDNFESIFFLMRLIILKDKPKHDLLREFDERIFKAGTLKRGVPFVELLFDYVRLYKEIFTDKSYIEADTQVGIKYQSLIHIMDAEFSASEWRACILSYAKRFGRDGFYEFLQAIEKLYLTQWTAGTRKDERYADYTLVLNAIDDAKTPAEATAKVPFDEDKIIKQVTRPIVYGAGFCKYALLRLELVTSEHDVPKRFSAKSIEHVFPQNPAAGSEWVKVAAGEEFGKFVHQIGNLVLISRSKNSSSSNLEFEEKKKKYLAVRVSDYPRSIGVLSYAEWNPEIIKQRTEEAGKLILSEI